MKRPKRRRLGFAAGWFILAVDNAFLCAALRVEELFLPVVLAIAGTVFCAMDWHQYWEERDKYKAWIDRRPADLKEDE